MSLNDLPPHPPDVFSLSVLSRPRCWLSSGSDALEARLKAALEREVEEEEERARQEIKKIRLENELTFVRALPISCRALSCSLARWSLVCSAGVVTIPLPGFWFCGAAAAHDPTSQDLLGGPQASRGL